MPSNSSTTVTFNSEALRGMSFAGQVLIDEAGSVDTHIAANNLVERINWEAFTAAVRDTTLFGQTTLDARELIPQGSSMPIDTQTLAPHQRYPEQTEGFTPDMIELFDNRMSNGSNPSPESAEHFVLECFNAHRDPSGSVVFDPRVPPRQESRSPFERLRQDYREREERRQSELYGQSPWVTFESEIRHGRHLQVNPAPTQPEMPDAPTPALDRTLAPRNPRNVVPHWKKFPNMINVDRRQTGKTTKLLKEMLDNFHHRSVFVSPNGTRANNAAEAFKAILDKRSIEYHYSHSSRRAVIIRDGEATITFYFVPFNDFPSGSEYAVYVDDLEDCLASHFRSSNTVASVNWTLTSGS
jgi:hypothetical protein